MTTNTSNATLKNWLEQESKIADISNFATYIADGKLHVVGGIFNNGRYVLARQYATINPLGNLEGWGYREGLPGPMTSHQAVVSGGCVYFIRKYTTANEQDYVYTPSADNLGHWAVLDNLPNVPYRDLKIHDGFAYLFGSFDHKDCPKFFHIARVDQHGVIGEWSAPVLMDLNVERNSQVFFTHNRVHLVGGTFNKNHDTFTMVRFAPICTDGTFGKWYNETPILGRLDPWGAAVVGNRVYMHAYTDLYTENTNNNVGLFTTRINSNGLLDRWVDEPYLSDNFSSTMLASNTHLYFVGGDITQDGDTSSIDSTQFISNKPHPTEKESAMAPLTIPQPNTNSTMTPIPQPLTTLGDWGVQASLLYPKDAESSVIIKGHVYMIGGTVNGIPSNSVYSSKIKPDGTLSPWVVAHPLPASVAWSKVVATSSRVYVFAAKTKLDDYLTDVYVADIQEDGKIGAGMLGTWANHYPASGSLLMMRSAEVYIKQMAMFNNRLYVITCSAGNESRLTIHVNHVTDDDKLVFDDVVDKGVVEIGEAMMLPMKTLPKLFFFKDRVYILNGNTEVPHSYNRRRTEVYSAVVFDNGLFGEWTLAAHVPLGFQLSNTVTTQERLYLQGWTTETQENNVIISAALNVDATLTPWVIEQPPPSDMYNPNVVSTDAHMYLLGGRIYDHATTTVYSSAFLSTKHPPPTEESIIENIVSDIDIKQFPACYEIPGSQSFITGNFLHVVGGEFNAISNPREKVLNPFVYSAPIGKDLSIGEWSMGYPLPEGISAAQVVVTNTNVYLLGGIDKAGPTNAIHSAPISSDGLLGKWTKTGSLPVTLAFSQAISTGIYIHVLGGVQNGRLSDVIYSALIHPDGTLGEWFVGGCLPTTFAYGHQFKASDIVVLAGGLIDNKHAETYMSIDINKDGTLGIDNGALGVGKTWRPSDEDESVRNVLDRIFGGALVNVAALTNPGTGLVVTKGLLSGEESTSVDVEGYYIYNGKVSIVFAASD